MKRPELTERERARAGPRALKEVGSPEWCWQTVDYLKDSLRHVDERWRVSEAVLDELIKVRAWKVIPSESPYGTLDEMLKEEVGLDADAIRQRIEEVRLADHGGDRHSPSFQADNIRLKDSYGTGETYIVRRLKRDHPDLAQQVLDGKVSAHAAGIEAGFVPRTATVPIDDPARLAATLRRRLAPDTLAALVKLLTS